MFIRAMNAIGAYKKGRSEVWDFGGGFYEKIIFNLSLKDK